MSRPFSAHGFIFLHHVFRLYSQDIKCLSCISRAFLADPSRCLCLFCAFLEGVRVKITHGSYERMLELHVMESGPSHFLPSFDFGFCASSGYPCMGTPAHPAASAPPPPSLFPGFRDREGIVTLVREYAQNDREAARRAWRFRPITKHKGPVARPLVHCAHCARLCALAGMLPTVFYRFIPIHRREQID
jgi:hypothetical protein